MRHVVGRVRPAGRARHGVQGADARGAGARLPLADPQRAAAGRGRSASSTARTTRTCSSCGCTSLVPRASWSGRYATINRFEQARGRRGTTIVKVMLHISRRGAEGAALAERLEPPGQVVEVQPRRHRRAAALAGLPGGLPGGARAVLDGRGALVRRARPTASGTPGWAVQQLLLEALERLDPQWPPADFDVEAEKSRLAGLTSRDMQPAGHAARRAAPPAGRPAGRPAAAAAGRRVHLAAGQHVAPRCPPAAQRVLAPAAVPVERAPTAGW